MNTEKHLQNSSIKSRIKFLLSDVSVYGIATALYSFIGILSIPILTHNISITDYGIFEILISIVGVATVLGTLGQDAAFARFHYDVESPGYRDNIVRLGFIIQFTASLFIMLCFMAIGTKIEQINPSYSKSVQAVLLLAAFVIPATSSYNYIRNVLKWTFRRGQYVAVSLLYAALLISSYYVLVQYMRTGLYGALMSMMLALIVPLAIGLVFFRAIRIGRIDFSYVVPMLSYGVPYMVLGVMNQGLRVVDKIAVSFYQGVEAAAVYAVGFKVASILLALDSLFHMSWGPISLAIFKESNAGKTYDMALNIVIGMMSLSLLVIAGFSDTIILLLAPANFLEASTAAIILSVGLALQSVAGIASIGIDLAKKTRLLVFSWCAGASVALGLIFQIGPKLGMIGVALSITMGFVVEGFVRIYMGQQVYKIRFREMRNVFYIPLAVLVMYVINNLPVPASVTNIAKLSIIAIFMAYWLKKLKTVLNVQAC